MLTKIGIDLADIEDVWPDVANTSPISLEIGQRLARFGQTWPSNDEIRPDLGGFEPNQCSRSNRSPTFEQLQSSPGLPGGSCEGRAASNRSATLWKNVMLSTLPTLAKDAAVAYQNRPESDRKHPCVVEATQLWSRSATCGRHRPNQFHVVGIGQIKSISLGFGRMRPILVGIGHMWPKSVNSCRNRHKIGRHRPSWVDFGPRLPEIGPNLAEFAPHLADQRPTCDVPPHVYAQHCDDSNWRSLRSYSLYLVYWGLSSGGSEN